MTTVLLNDVWKRSASVGVQPAAPQAWKDALNFAYLHCGWVAARDVLLARVGRARAVIVAYHRVGDPGVLSRTPEQFRQDLAYFQRHFDVVTLAELCARLRRPLRRSCLAVTFDDGYKDNGTSAAPILEEAGLRGTFFVATGFIGTQREFPHDLRRQDAASPALPSERPKLTWDDLRAMQAAGHEIGSHTVNHVNLGLADRDEVEFEIRASLAALQHELGERPRAFAFPWGKPGDVGKHALTALARAGYYAAVTAHGGVNGVGANPLLLRRVDVGNGRLSRQAVRARVRGLDPDSWRYRRARMRT